MGQWCYEQDEIRHLAVAFCNSLFEEDNEGAIEAFPIRNVFSPLDKDKVARLLRELQGEVVCKAMFTMGPIRHLPQMGINHAYFKRIGS